MIGLESVGCMVPRFPAKSLGQESTSGICIVKYTRVTALSLLFKRLSAWLTEVEVDLRKRYSAQNCGGKARLIGLGRVGCMVPRFPAKSLGQESTSGTYIVKCTRVDRAFPLV